MKLLPIIPVFIILFIGCQTQRYLPDVVVKKINFGMSLNDFIALKGDKVQLEDSEMSFRAVYTENLEENASVEAIVYYFDQDGEKPLYEVIVVYKSVELLNKEASTLLGVPNHNKTEWKISPKNQLDIIAWKTKTKLVVVSLIPNTEWYENGNN